MRRARFRIDSSGVGLAFLIPVLAAVLTVAATASSSAQAAVVVTIVEPAPGQLVGDDLLVVASIDSIYEIDTVLATVEDRSTSLAYDPWTGWTATLSLAGLERGAKTLLVTATDVFGTPGEASRDFVYDRPPEVAMTLPLANSVARPEIEVAASCADDDPVGCVLMEVAVGSCTSVGLPVYSTSAASFAEIFTIDPYYEGLSPRLRVVATDSEGQETCVERRIFVDSSPGLVESESIEGLIWDADALRILYLDGRALRIRDRQLGTDTTIMDGADHLPKYGFLTPTGAIFVDQPGTVTTAEIYDWNGGQLYDLGHPNASNSLATSGDYATWSVGTELYLRQLSTTTTELVASDAGNNTNGVGGNGTVFYWSDTYEIMRYKDGVTTQITFDAPYHSVYPATDGVRAIYRKGTDLGTEIALYDPDGGETILTEGGCAGEGPPDHYQIANGWAAYLETGSSYQCQVWRRSPDGSGEQLTFWTTSNTLDSLSDNGDVTFLNSYRTYLVAAGSTTSEDICSNLGVSIWVDGVLHRAIGRTLFTVDAVYGGIFADGFESGDLGAWTLTVP